MDLLKIASVPAAMVSPSSTVFDAVQLMNDQKVGAVAITNDSVLAGIFTERDAITRVLGAGLDPTSTAVSGVMTKNPVSVSTSTSLEEAMSIVTNRRIRHLPVVDDGKVLGVVSSGDLTYHWVGD